MPVILAFCVASIVLAITPGPDMTLMLGRTLSQGRKAGFAVLAGTIAGNMVHTVLVVVGISALIAASPTAFFTLKLAGAVYLLWLAFQALYRSSTFAMPREKRPPHGFLKNFASGFGVDILNPKVVLFFLTFLPQFVSAADPHAARKLLFLGLLISVISTPINITIIMLAHRFANAMKSRPAINRIIDYLFGSVFAVFAIRILLTQTSR